MKKPQEIRAMFRAAERELNEYVEAEMFRLMREHPSLGCLVKCMGELTPYQKDGQPFWHDEEPKFLRPLQELLDELDRNYACRTGQPLKITRGSPDRTALHHTRDWWMAHYTDVIGYAWQADTHCVACTKAAHDKGVLKVDDTHPHAHVTVCKICGEPEIEHPHSLRAKWQPPLMCCAFGQIQKDTNGVRYNLVDPEGNIIHPVFLGEEGNINEHCGDCGAALFPH